MCGCTQVRLATLQAIAECSTHSHTHTKAVSLEKKGEKGTGAECVNTSDNVVLLTVSSALALLVSADCIYLDIKK